MLLIIISTSLFVFYSALILYYRKAWKSIPHAEDSSVNGSTTISVIIPARNEEVNIKTCLDSILRGDYPSHLYEVIVIDDHSDDATADIIKFYSGRNVHLINLKEELKGLQLNSYKKKAIEIAVQKALGRLIVTTDADCILPEKWLSTIASFYEKHNPAFIAAPVSYYRENSFLKIFQSLDFMTLQGITGAAVYNKFHNMCNGANLAYEKEAFYKVDGFKGIDALASGDDMLLMHKIYMQYPDRVMYLKSRDTIARTQPMNTWSKFFHQRIRWASKSDSYTDKKIIMVLMLVYLFNACLLVMGLAAFFSLAIFHWLLAILVFKVIIELLFLYPVAEFFNKRKLLWYFALAQPLHIIYILIAGWLGKFGSYNWKGRKVK